MITASESVEEILNEVAICIRQIPNKNLLKSEMLIESASRIFVSGVGRSGLCMRALGMRLMHLNKVVHIIGDVTTPSIQKEDLLIVGSGSGKTLSLLAIAKRARDKGRKYYCLQQRGHHRFPS